MAKLSERALAKIAAREEEEKIDSYSKFANDRKRVVYWIGFLEGALSSKRIEDGETSAIYAEAEKFAKFFEDPDASDLAQDIESGCISDEGDFIDLLTSVIDEKRSMMLEASPFSEKDVLNEFLGFCAGIICDGKILQPEVEAILGRFKASNVLQESAPFAQLRRAVEAAMADHIVSDTEAREIEEWIAHLVGSGYVDTGIPNIGQVAVLDEPITDAREIQLHGSTFVLTGPMQMGPRSFIVDELNRVGATYAERTTSATDYVVVSNNASKNWRTTSFGTKIERAKELIDQGHKLRFVSETALARAIAMVT